MLTVGAPRTITPPCAVWSPMRAAGMPPIITFVEPITIESGGATHVHMSPTRAAGIPAIRTVGHPGGRIGPPTWGTTPVTIAQVCMSPTRAAGGMAAIVSASDDGCNRAAVDRPVGAGDVGCALGAQEDDDVRDLLRRAEAADRHLGLLDLDRLLARDPARRRGLVGQSPLGGPQLACHRARCDGVHEHALAGV